MAGPDGEYTDDYRATQLVGADGAYRFESHFPPPYSGRPPHIHLRVSAEGYQTLVTQHYPKEGETSASFDLVLVSQP
jgi:protocatechuate 3,4-dioxygenase beta subunit